MSNINKTEKDDSEQAAMTRSRVTPKSTFNQSKDKLLFAGLVLIVLVVVVFMLMPSKKTLRADNEGDSANQAQVTLAQNLALIAQMKEQAQALRQAANAAPDTRPNHPPILRGDKNKTATLSQETLARMNASSAFALESSTLNPDGVALKTDGAHGLLTGNNANVAFVNQQDEIIAVSAKRIPHPHFTVPAGELIPATLEVAINSELPGMVRAITARDIYSLSGNTPLIPSGSTLVGQFNSGVVQGQSRLLVVWNRVQMPDGVIVVLNSPGTDAIGRAGQGADSINRHFMERFGSGALLSILGGAAATSGVGSQDQYNSKSQYRMGIANSLQQAASQSLEEEMVIKPTLSINQGARINVFVAHDLDFYAVGAAHSARNPTLGRRGGVAWK